MFFINSLKLSILNLAYLLGGFVCFGLVFGKIETLNNKFIYSVFGKLGIIITGFVGTVVHELSHLLVALIFGHKIVDVRLFRPISGQVDGTLGYVSHKYNNKNIYHRIGNFFIGIAPLIGGTLTILLLLRFLLPDTYMSLKLHIDFYHYSSLLDGGNLFSLFQLLISDIFYMLKLLFVSSNIFSFNYLLFMFCTYSITTHMSLSVADLNNSAEGALSIFGIVFGISMIITVLNITYTIPAALIQYNILVTMFLGIGLAFALLTLSISFIFSIIF